MITRMAIENFKSIKRVTLELGPLNIFIGTNASGKSNLFDALRVLQGIGNGFTISEILDGKPKGATSEVWEGIRGGSAKACFAGDMTTGEIVLAVAGQLDGDQAPWDYLVGLAPGEGRVTRERLSRGADVVYDSEAVARNLLTDPIFEVRYYGGKAGRQPHLRFERNRPVLTQMARGGNGKWQRAHGEFAGAVATLLANTQRVDPMPALLRSYSQAHQIARMGEHGENFAALIRTICTNPGAKDAYLTWLRQLRPAEVEDVGTLAGAVGEPLFVLRERGTDFPAPILSDGTLRFAAITAAFFQGDLPALLTIEEIENGVHASRVRLLVELLRSQTASRRTQVMVTTHSPIVLAWLERAEYAHTFFFKRNEQTGESQISPLTEVPHFLEVVQRQPIGDLFAEGWLEAAL